MYLRDVYVVKGGQTDEGNQKQCPDSIATGLAEIVRVINSSYRDADVTRSDFSGNIANIEVIDVSTDS